MIMEKRIHTKKSVRLPYRHYFLHFKWPLFICGFILIVISYFHNPFNNDEFFSDEIFVDVLYPIDIRNNPPTNQSILYYFKKKDQLKSDDDLQSMKRKQKEIHPMKTNLSLGKNSYLILEYTPVFDQPRFCSHQREEIFGKKCPFTNCEYTCDRQREKDADVLLMHKRDLKYSELDRLKRNTEQIWLLWHDESNENTPEINKYRFNWTMSYRTSAEASLAAYGITIVKSKSWSRKRFDTWIDNEFKKRANQAVWFVSNCLPKKRLENFRLLRQFYSVAAFGKCIKENETLSLNAEDQLAKQCGRQSSCEKVYLTGSKFYLAFESQSCTDYITEKFWRTLYFGVIPIVSGPKRENFQRVAPPNSFIHLDDFQSIKDLAQTLQMIATDRNLFAKYHSWRRFYDVYYEAKDLDPYRFCELCYRLNNNRKRIWYENLNEWFLENC